MRSSGRYINPTVWQAEGGPTRTVYGRTEKDMNPVPDDVLLPCHWIHERIREDGMEFRRDDDRFAITVLRREECPSLPVLGSGQCWEIRLDQRAGEARSSTSLGCVTTRRTALDTILRYMTRINEAIDREGPLAPGAMIELLSGETPSENDDWERTSTEWITVDSPTL